MPMGRIQRKTVTHHHLLAALLAIASVGMTQTRAFLMPPPGVAVRKAGTRTPPNTYAAVMDAPVSTGALVDTQGPRISTQKSTGRRGRRRPTSAPPSSSASHPTNDHPRQNEVIHAPDSHASSTEHDILMQGRINAVQRAAVAIQKQRSLSKTLGRAPTGAEWAQALGGVTEEGLGPLLRQGTVAQAELVKGWEGLVTMFVGKYAQSLSDSELQDLVVEGQMGVVEAALRFQGGQGATFKTYAFYWVRKRVMDAAAMYDRSTFAGAHEARQASLVKKAVQSHERETGGKILSTPEIADKVGIPSAKVEQLARRGKRYGLMERSSGQDGLGRGTSLRFSDTLQDTEYVGGDQVRVLDSMYVSEVEEAVRLAVARLPQEERTVLNHRLGLEDGLPKTWEELGQVMDGCSVSYMRKVEAKAKTHLRRNVDVVRLVHRRPASFDETFVAAGGE